MGLPEVNYRTRVQVQREMGEDKNWEMKQAKKLGESNPMLADFLTQCVQNPNMISPKGLTTTVLIILRLLEIESDRIYEIDSSN